MSAHPLSVQLYTVREAAGDDLAGTLNRLAQIGFELVEPYAFTSFGPALAEALKESGLRAPTTHQSFLSESGGGLRDIFAAARDLGIETVIDPHHPTQYWQRPEDILATAARLNAAAKVAAEYGLKVGYHNHAHEIAASIGGITALEFLAENLDDDVALQVDAYWVAVGGADPVALLSSLGDRVVAVHVKDGPGTREPLDQVAVGSGSQPIAEILAATPDALHVIELDNSRGDRFTAVADSFAFLTNLRGQA